MPLDRKSSQDIPPLERPRCHTAPPCYSSPCDDNFDFCTESNSLLHANNCEDSEPGSIQGGQTVSEILVTASQSFPGRKPKTKKGPRSRRTADTVDIPSRVFIGGLTPEINEDDLRELFGSFGEILTVYIKNRGSDKHRGFAFVTFKRRTDADRIVDESINRRSFDIKDTELKVLPAFRHLKQYDTPSPTDAHPLPPKKPASPPIPRKPGYGDYPSYPFAPSISPALVRRPPVQSIPFFPGAFIPLPYPGIIPYFPYYDPHMPPPNFIPQFGGFHIAPNRFYNPGFGPPLNFPAYQRRPNQTSHAPPDHQGSGGDFRQPSCTSCPSCNEKRPTSAATSVSSDHTCCASCTACDVPKPHRTENLRTKHGSTGCGASDPCRKSANQTPFDDSGVDVSSSPRSC